MSSKKKVGTTLIPAIVSIVFAAFAITFGMGEWKPGPATASAPSTVTHN